MGMLQTIIKACKVGFDFNIYEKTLHQQAANLRAYGDDEGDKPEGVAVIKLTEANFEEYWQDQENLKSTPEVKAKYLQCAKEGRAWAIEVEW
jgi:hypothetical protein